MKLNKTNIPDFDDLLFESRNKDYGSYQLRKRYNSVVITGTIIASFIGCMAVIIPFILRPSADKIFNSGSRFTQIQMDNLESPKEVIYIPQSPPPPELKKIQEIPKYIIPKVVDTLVSLKSTLAVTDEISAFTKDTLPAVNYGGIGDDSLSGESGSNLDGAFFIVEVLPTFKGGDKLKFREWVSRNMIYPQEAVDKKIKGKVVITFVVEKDGSVSNVSIVKGVHPLLDNEAVKVISESPKWIPGFQRGRPVRVRFVIPLNFSPG
jgi:protein TonB